MPYLFQSSQVSLPLWQAAVLALIAASSGWLGSWLNRKRRSSVQAEDGKLSAEAHSLEIQSIGELLQQVRDIRAETATIEAEASKRAEENRRQQKFLREQLIWHEELSIRARAAAHAAINEIQRCVLAIHLRDEAIKAANLATDIPLFEQKEYEDIVKFQKLPMPPRQN